MKSWISGTLHLPNEDVEITIEDDSAPDIISGYYNEAKEIIIAAEEERRAKLNKEKEEQD